jgi:uncharacterized protein DUF6527
MQREITLKHEFVEYIPDDLKEGTVYVSIAFATVAHRCCCGCGNQVITPLSPTDWEITFDGKFISLYPSIGNWGFPCQSHYWIKRNRVKWAPRWSKKQIEAGRLNDRIVKERYFDQTQTLPTDDNTGADAERSQEEKSTESHSRKPKSWWT